jgi:hypothetical protein
VSDCPAVAVKEFDGLPFLIFMEVGARSQPCFQKLAPAFRCSGPKPSAHPKQGGFWSMLGRDHAFLFILKSPRTLNRRYCLPYPYAVPTPGRTCSLAPVFGTRPRAHDIQTTSVNRPTNRTQFLGAYRRLLFFLILYSQGYRPLIPTTPGVPATSALRQISEQGHKARDSSRLAHQAADRYP